MEPGYLEISSEQGADRLRLTGEVLHWPAPPREPRLEVQGDGGGARVVLLDARDVPAGGDREHRLMPERPLQLARLGLCLHREAHLEELPSAAPGETGVDAAQLLRAGLLVEGGFVPGKLRGRLERAVLDGSFEPIAAAAEIGAQARTTEDVEGILRQRAARLLRDFVMARRQRGLHGALRRGREGARSLLAALFVQLLALGVYSLIVLILLVFWRARGHSLDGLLDAVLRPFTGPAP